MDEPELCLWAYTGLCCGGPLNLGEGGGPKRGLIADGIDMVAEVDGREEGYWLNGD